MTEFKLSSRTKATILTENDGVPGCKFECEPANYTVEQLKRWLKCRGHTQAGKREDLLARVKDIFPGPVKLNIDLTRKLSKNTSYSGWKPGALLS